MTVVAAACAKAPARLPALQADTTENVSTQGFEPNPNEILMVGLFPVGVRRTVTLVRVGVEMQYGAITLLGSRITFMACPGCGVNVGRTTLNGAAGGECSTGPWPPKGFGPSYPVDGLVLQPGDQPEVVLYFRPTSPSTRSAAITVTYREGQGPEQTVRIVSQRFETRPRRTPAGDRCPSDSVWFGG